MENATVGPKPHAIRFSDGGLSVVASPAAVFQGTAAVPFRKASSAVAAGKVVLAGAAEMEPVDEAMPKPSHTTGSSLWHAVISSPTSAAHSAGHMRAEACRHGYGMFMKPAATVMLGLEAVCEYPAT